MPTYQRNWEPDETFDSAGPCEVGRKACRSIQTFKESAAGLKGPKTGISGARLSEAMEREDDCDRSKIQFRVKGNDQGSSKRTSLKIRTQGGTAR